LLAVTTKEKERDSLVKGRRKIESGLGWRPRPFIGKHEGKNWNELEESGRKKSPVWVKEKTIRPIIPQYKTCKRRGVEKRELDEKTDRLG